jgi:hypothetical protein
MTSKEQVIEELIRVFTESVKVRKTFDVMGEAYEDKSIPVHLEDFHIIFEFPFDLDSYGLLGKEFHGTKRFRTLKLKEKITEDVL